MTNEIERSYRTGIELSMKYKAGKYFQFINSSAYNKSRVKEKSQSFTPILTPPILINQEVNFSHNSYLIGISARYQSSSYINFANNAQVNQYFTLNTRVQYNYKSIQIGFFAYNITNTQYFNNGYVDMDGTKKYFVQAPANYYVSIIYTTK